MPEDRNKEALDRIIREQEEDAGLTSFSYDTREPVAVSIAKQVEKFKKYDSKKVDLSLLPAKQIEDVVRVMQHGSKKYGRFNWKLCEEPDRYIAACLRHFFAFMEGEKCDKESGLTHLAHAACNIIFLMHLMEQIDNGVAEGNEVSR